MRYWMIDTRCQIEEECDEEDMNLLIDGSRQRIVIEQRGSLQILSKKEQINVFLIVTWWDEEAPNDTQEKSEKRSSSRPWESDRFRKWSTDRNSHPDRTNRTGRETVESSSRSFSSNSNRSTLQTTKPSKQSQQDNSEFFLEGADYDQYISNQLKWKSIPVTRGYHILENGVLDVGVDLDDPVEIPTSEHIEEKSGKEWWRGIIR